MAHRMVIMAALGVVGSTAVAAQAPAPWRSFDAAVDPAGDAVWANTGTAQTGQPQNFSFTDSVTASDVNDPIAFGISKAYEISSTGAIRGASWAFFGQNGGGRANFPENTFELFFRVDDLSGQHILMEIGGSVAGLSMAMDDGNLVWATNPGGPDTTTTHVIETAIGTGWNHAVATWSRLTDTTSLYLNGQFVGAVDIASTSNGWTGSNEASLGGNTTNSAATTFDAATSTDFDGAIAVFNYYREELTGEQIQANFDARLIPAPGSAALIAMAGLVSARRRR